MSRDFSFYVEDMLEATRRVARYAAGLTQEAFLADVKTVDAVVRNLEILGEAAKHVPEDIRALHASIEWRKIAGLRDVLAVSKRFTQNGCVTPNSSAASRWTSRTVRIVTP